jgi:hypothetical protein
VTIAAPPHHFAQGERGVDGPTLANSDAVTISLLNGGEGSMNATDRISVPILTLLTIAAVLLAISCGPRPLTPEEAKARGDELLKQMSQKLAATQAFSYTAEQNAERVGDNGQKATRHIIRRVTVQRPNRLTFADEGPDSAAVAWYDGKQITVVANRDKIWVRGPMPGTLDEGLDYLSAEYDINFPTADLLYSNPYEALMTPDTTGGWIKVEQLGTRSCDHLSYQQAVVDWQLWLTNDDRHLPCQLSITYKSVVGQPTTRVVFTDWNEAPTITDATFTPVVPDGYRRIKIMRHATVIDEKATEKAGGGHD